MLVTKRREKFKNLKFLLLELLYFLKLYLALTLLLPFGGKCCGVPLTNFLSIKERGRERQVFLSIFFAAQQSKHNEPVLGPKTQCRVKVASRWA